MGKQFNKRSWEAAKLRSLLTDVIGLFNPMLEKVARVPRAKFLGTILNKGQEKKDRTVWQGKGIEEGRIQKTYPKYWKEGYFFVFK